MKKITEELIKSEIEEKLEASDRSLRDILYDVMFCGHCDACHLVVTDLPWVVDTIKTWILKEIIRKDKVIK